MINMKETIYIEYQIVPNLFFFNWEYLNLPKNWNLDLNFNISESNFAHISQSFSGSEDNKDVAYSYLSEFFENLKRNEIISSFKIIEKLELQ